MSIWRTVRGELAGAWRSLRYDLGKRPIEPVMPDLSEITEARFDNYERPPRRLLAASAFGLLALTGAAGSYFAVVNGLGSLLDPQTSAPAPRPAVAATTSASPSAVTGVGPARTAPARDGSGTAPAGGTSGGQYADVPAPAFPDGTVSGAGPRSGGRPAPGAQVPTCCAPAPAYPPPTVRPTPTANPTPDGSTTADPEATPSTSPGGEASPTDSPRPY